MSIGLAHQQPGHGSADLHELLTRADTALRGAKTAGRDRIEAA